MARGLTINAFFTDFQALREATMMQVLELGDCDDVDLADREGVEWADREDEERDDSEDEEWPHQEDMEWAITPVGTRKHQGRTADVYSVEIIPDSGRWRQVLHFGVYTATTATLSDLPLPPGSFPRFWRLLSYFLPRSSRKRVFETASAELLQDYYETRGKYRTPWSRRMLWLAFFFRTALLVWGCLWEWAGDRALAGACWAFPVLRRWFPRPE